MRITAIVLFLVCASISHAEIPINVTTTYAEGSVNLYYEGLNESSEVFLIKITECSDEPSPPKKGLYFCEPLSTQNGDVDDSKVLEISDPGLFLVTFYSNSCPSCTDFFSDLRNIVVWQQYVINLETRSQSLREAAQSYAPYYSFFPDEQEYFPVSINTLFNRSVLDFDEFDLQLVDYFEFKLGANSSDSAKSLLISNGHVQNKLTLKKDIAQSLRGLKSSFPVYWYIEEESDTSAWVTYFTLFAYDKKHSEYIQTSPLASYGDHEIDRESIAIKFEKNSTDSWEPQQVVYAGHKNTQPTTFKGCQDTFLCDAPGDLMVTWPNGKTAVSWDLVSKIGDRPVAYVAHGSHAMTPGVGYYGIEVEGFGLFDVEEPAGSVGIESLTSPQQIEELDLSRPEHAALAYSGFLIKGVDEWLRVFPFVRYPTSRWALNAGSEFNDCIRDQLGCENHIHPNVDASAQRITNFPNLSTKIFQVAEHEEKIYLTVQVAQYAPIGLYEAKGIDTAPPPVYMTTPGNSQVRSITSYNDQLYVVANDENNIPVIYTEGLGAFTRECFDQLVTPCATGVNSIKRVGDRLIVTQIENGVAQAYVLNSSGSGLRPFKADDDGRELFGEMEFTPVGNRVYFRAGSVGDGVNIWGTDFAPYEGFWMGARMIPIDGDLTRTNAATNLLVPFKNRLYFDVRLQGTGRADHVLWNTDGLTNNVKNHDLPSGTNIGPNKMVATNNRIYIRYGLPNWLLSTDGTEESITFYPAITNVEEMLPINDTLYFTTVDSTLGPSKLYRAVADGGIEVVAEYTRIIKDLRNFRGELYFIDNNLKKVTSDGTVQAIDLNGAGGQKIFPGDDAALYFQAYDAISGPELWVYK